MIFYVHIGKTGGTSLKRQIRASYRVKKRKEPQVIGDDLVLLNHISVADAAAKFGEPTGLAFAFRDPAERFVSGFYCRQRMGFPDHKAMWDAREAAAFAHFDAANDLAEALSDDSPARRAAAQYAMGAIRHLRRGYAYHFGPLAHFFLEHAERVVACIETCNIDAKGAGFLRGLGASPSPPAAPQTVEAKVDFPRGLSDLAVRNLQEIWSVEYDYYHAFKALEAHLSGQ